MARSTMPEHSAVVPASAQVAVFDAANGPFRLARYPLRPVEDTEVLVRVRMSTICRSDIHSWQGKRPSPCPGLLGHEIVGTIVALGAAITHDMREAPLAVGDRITWSEYFVPGRSWMRDVLDMPQKAPGVDKYGHLSSDTPPHHHGGFGEFCYIRPDSWILKLPDELSDQEATPINCGVATMCAVIEAADVQIGQTVVIQGLGLLGLYGAALAKSRGAALVIGVEALESRRALGLQFGVDQAYAPDAVQIPLRGADCVIEVCGDPGALVSGMQWLRPGGRFVVAGLVNPNATVTLDAHRILRQCLTIVGVHNYHPRHLPQALDFILTHRAVYPFHALVDRSYPLAQITQAMSDAAQRHVLRAAICP
jgi:putative phosphonate catabolism associated alcohol dehydrogenase